MGWACHAIGRGWRPWLWLALAVGVPAHGQAPQTAPAPAGAAPAAVRAGQPPADPRIGLAAGLHDAGEAARHMRKVASLPKPVGFFDPTAPAGEPTPPETPEDENAPQPTEEAEEDPPVSPAPGTPGGRPAAAPPPGASALDYANSDLAFGRGHLFVGNFSGFNIYRLGERGRLDLVSSVVCPGGQGDVSVYGNLLVMSVEQPRGRLDCGTQGVTRRVSPERFRGVRVFDISDLAKPRQVAAVQTCRGSHTHTIVTSPGDRDHLYVYGSGTALVRSPKELAECSGKDPKEDPKTALFSIDVIRIPLAAPERAAVVNRPRIFADPETGAIAGLWPGGRHGEGTQKTSVTNQCHDITVFPEGGLAAGACSGNGILLDITDPVHPKRIDQVVDRNFAYWHSATFNNDGTKVIFTDEWGGGIRPRCRPTDPPNWGANAIFEIVDRKLRFAGYYKLPVPQTEQENCVAHNGSLVPVPGRDIMVQGWYQGGISVFDFTDPARPVEIAFFDRGPLDATRLITGGHWSAYWYNGLIYGAEMARGIDVFELTPSEHLSANEIEAARLATSAEFNAQRQTKAAWPASPAVARAYLDQLVRGKAIEPARADAVTAALARTGKGTADREAFASLAAQLERDASGAGGRDAQRLRSLAETLRTLEASRP